MTGTPKQLDLALALAPTAPTPVPSATAPQLVLPQPLELVEIRNGRLGILPATRPKVAVPHTSAARCSEKGCVFPAARSESGKCRQHDRQHSEPALFRSRQPSTLLLDHAKFGVPESGPQEARPNDKRRMSKLWESFLEGAA